MKLLIFCPYYPPHTGGLESHADEFNKHLSQKGVDITVFTPRLPKDSPKSEIKYNDVKIIRFPAFEIISNYPLPKFWTVEFWKLFLSLYKKDFNIIISRTRFFSTSLLAFFYAKIRGIKWIHIEHGSDFVQLSSKFKSIIAKIYDHIFGRLVFKYSDQNISISKAVQKFILKFDKRESPIIYRGLNFEEIDVIEPNNEVKEKYQDKTIISFAGRLYKWKGVENSIKAIKSLPEEIKNKIVFLIIGDGEDFLQLKEISKNESSIKMLGNLSRRETIGILKSSDIYIHSAYPGGGLSTSLLEAMYCECSVIATLNEGADEVIKNNEDGILIEKSDVNLIAEKIQSLLIDANMNSFKEQAKETIRENFIWEKSIIDYMETFDKIK